MRPIHAFLALYPGLQATISPSKHMGSAMDEPVGLVHLRDSPISAINVPPFMGRSCQIKAHHIEPKSKLASCTKPGKSWSAVCSSNKCLGNELRSNKSTHYNRLYMLSVGFFETSSIL